VAATSGSGKSTLLNILGGLDLPTEGRVRYRDQDLSTLDGGGLTEYRRRHVGFVFQFNKRTGGPRGSRSLRGGLVIDYRFSGGSGRLR